MSTQISDANNNQSPDSPNPATTYATVTKRKFIHITEAAVTPSQSSPSTTFSAMLQSLPTYHQPGGVGGRPGSVQSYVHGGATYYQHSGVRAPPPPQQAHSYYTSSANNALLQQQQFILVPHMAPQSILPNVNNSYFMNAQSRLYHQPAVAPPPPPHAQSSMLAPVSMTQSMYDARSPHRSPRRYVKNPVNQGGRHGGGRPPPPRTYGKTKRKPQHHGSLGLLNSLVAKATVDDEFDTMSMVDGAADGISSNLDPSKKLSETRTSKSRLQAYYTLVWEDEDETKEPPNAYSDDNMTNNDSDEYDFDENVYAGCSSYSSDGGGPRGGGGRGTEDQELDSKTLQVQNKRFYVDVKQNWHGRYVKVAEVGQAGPFPRRKSRVLFSMPAAADFVKRLDDMLEFVETLPPAKPTPRPVGNGNNNGERPPPSVALKTIAMECTAGAEHRTYSIELHENPRGRYLRVSMNVQGGAVQFGQRNVRSVVQMPDIGIVDLRNALEPLVAKWNKDLPVDASYKGAMPESDSLRVGGKTFYFDYGQTQRGVFMRLSEVRPAWRTSVTIPRNQWEAMRDMFAEGCKIVPPEESQK